MRNICCLTLLRRSCLHTVVLLCGGNGSTINSRNLRSDPRNRLPKDQLGTAANGISALVAKHTSGSVRIATNFSRKLKAAHLRIVRCAHSSEVKKTACRFQLVAPIPADTYFASRFDPTTGAGRSIPLDTYRPLNPDLFPSAPCPYLPSPMSEARLFSQLASGNTSLLPSKRAPPQVSTKDMINLDQVQLTSSVSSLHMIFSSSWLL